MSASDDARRISADDRRKRVCAFLRRVSPIPWVSGALIVLFLSKEHGLWVGPLALLLCFASVFAALIGLSGLIFFEDEQGRTEQDKFGKILGLIGVLGAFATAFFSLQATPTS